MLLCFDSLQNKYAPVENKLWFGRELHIQLTFKNHASYIQDVRTDTLQMLHFVFFF
jgi:hypothetical protein